MCLLRRKNENVDTKSNETLSKGGHGCWYSTQTEIHGWIGQVAKVQTMMTLKQALLSMLIVSQTAMFVSHNAEASLGSMVSEGQAKFNFRFRYEAVDQDGILEDASASTLRSRFTWNSKQDHKWKLGFEADHVAVIGSEDFNSTENGNTQFPVVADPEGLDLNQAFVKYEGEAVTVTFGRQRISHDGQRFVVGVAWRQNEQTYDALRLQTEVGSVKLDYSYVWNVNRIFGPDDGAQPADWEGDTHLLNATMFDNGKHKIKGQAYLLDFENDNGPANSTETYGVSYAGKVGNVKLTAAYATQTDYQDSPLDYRADYIEASAAFAFPSFGVKAGIEILGSDDGDAGFRTPLATLHKFQGWSDVFLNTPADGIEETYVRVNGAVSKVKMALSYHLYQANEGSADYGSEVQFVANLKINDAMSAQAKYASYDAEDFATDRNKFWLTFSYQT